jgi:hypothetical protein
MRGDVSHLQIEHARTLESSGTTGFLQRQSRPHLVERVLDQKRRLFPDSSTLSSFRPAVREDVGPTRESLDSEAQEFIESRFGIDFSLIPAHTESPISSQPTVAIGKQGSVWEQEADQISEQVMSSGEPSQSGDVRPNTRAHEPVQNLLTKRALPSDAERIEAPIVGEVLGSPGSPLDLSTRAFMERRFGQDFGHVRVHSDTRAAASADSIDALAYTVAPDIVFGAGQYAPHTTEGAALLAHELVHVVQGNSSDTVYRRPTKKKSKATRRDAWLKELAARPHDAHKEWKRLTGLEKVAVTVEMTKRYGDEFAKSFMQFTKRPIKSSSIHYGPNFPEHTPQWFEARGYRLWERSSVNEFWVHPSGNSIMQIRDQKPPAPTNEPSTEDAPVPDAEEEESEDGASAPVEEADLTEGQRKAMALLQQMEHMNADFKGMLDAQPPKTSEFIDKESQFRALRREFHELVLDDESLSDPGFAVYLTDRRTAVDEFLKLRNRAYRTDMPDWENLENEPTR